MENSMSFTEEQIEAITQAIEKHGALRLKTQGARFSEVDFLAGAMVAFFATESQRNIPNHYIFGPMTGRSVFPITPDQEKARNKYIWFAENADRIEWFLKSVPNHTQSDIREYARELLNSYHEQVRYETSEEDTDE
jgi:hypothetical protein